MVPQGRWKLHPEMATCLGDQSSDGRGTGCRQQSWPRLLAGRGVGRAAEEGFPRRESNQRPKGCGGDSQLGQGYQHRGNRRLRVRS